MLPVPEYRADGQDKLVVRYEVARHLHSIVPSVFKDTKDFKDEAGCVRFGT